MVICLVYKKDGTNVAERTVQSRDWRKEESQPSTDKSISLRVLDL